MTLPTDSQRVAYERAFAVVRATHVAAYASAKAAYSAARADALDNGPAAATYKSACAEADEVARRAYAAATAAYEAACAAASAPATGAGSVAPAAEVRGTTASPARSGGSKMAFCPSCSQRVLPMGDGHCPGCGRPVMSGTRGSATAARRAGPLSEDIVVLANGDFLWVYNGQSLPGVCGRCGQPSLRGHVVHFDNPEPGNGNPLTDALVNLSLTFRIISFFTAPKPLPGIRITVPQCDPCTRAHGAPGPVELDFRQRRMLIPVHPGFIDALEAMVEAKAGTNRIKR